MLNYLENLNWKWKEEAVKIFVLKVAISAYPLIKESGGGFNAPLALIVPNERMAENIFHELSGFNFSQIISLGEKRKEFEKCLAEVQYELFPVICNDTNKQNRDNLMTLKRIMTSGKVNGQYFGVLPVVACIGGVPNEFASLFSAQILLDGKYSMGSFANSNEITRKIIEIIIDKLPAIRTILENLRGDERLFFLYSMKEITALVLQQIKKNETDIAEKMMKEIEQVSGKLEANWNMESDYRMWIELLQKMMFKSSGSIRKAIDRNDVPQGDIQLIDRCLLFDAKYYYVTNEFFDNVCKKIPYVNNIEMKKALNSLGILVGEGVERSYYTVKVPVFTANGVKVIGRRLRFIRKWLDLPGELTWQERIEEQVKNRLVIVTPPNINSTKK